MMSAVACSVCQHPLPAGAAYCDGCGARAPLESTLQMNMQSVGGRSSSRESYPTAYADRTAYAEPPSREPETVESAKPPPVEPRRPSRGIRTLVLLGVLAFVLGAAGRLAWAAATSDNVPDPGEVVAQIPFDPNGTEATFDKGAGKVKVPAGAVSKPQTVTIYKQVIRDRVRAVPPRGGQPLVFPPGALVIYIFSPITIRLNVPITVTLTIPAGQRGLVFVTADGQIRVLPGVGTGRTVTLVISSFDFTRPGAITVRDDDD